MKQTKTIIRRLALLALILTALTAAVLAADNPEQFYMELETHLRNQDALFTITYNGDRSDLGVGDRASFGVFQRSLMSRSPDGPDSADYYALNVNKAAVTEADGEYAFDMEYLCTPEQLAEVDRQVPGIIKDLDLSGMDAEARVKLIYEYVCTHFIYDTTETKFSAYDGLTTGSMVCQGYALLLSKLMWEAEVPCRIIAGRSQNQTHAWNIVQLDGMWYNLDATWDGADELDKPMKWAYFLKSQADFTDHTRFAELDSETYHQTHPIAAESRVLRRVALQSGGEEIVNLVVRKGTPVSIEAVLPEGESAEVVWNTGDSDVLLVDENGLLNGQTPGETILTATAPGLRDVIAAKITVFVVDLTSASPWAQETVTKYYLNQLLPVELCGNLQQNLTRAELAKLCYHYVFKVQGWETAALRNPFSDLEDEPFAIQILRCNDVGIMTGVSSGTFQPQGTVTREQAATVLCRLIGYLTGNQPQASGEPPYDDNGSLSGWARDNVAAISETGILQGAGHLFRPRDPITRQEMILTLDRVFEKYPVEKKEPASDTEGDTENVPEDGADNAEG